ncbi:MAG TPA: protein tyrosine kinase, partial [Acidimicrobiaceae bacterium]|nr:protein tyrosine kinase [Acidimicrobiaceae bacterium]
LLVDADLRAPTVAGAFALADGHGLSDALMGTGAGVTNVAPHLTVLPAGSPAPNPAVLISSAALAALLRDVRESFDLVVIDGPPVMVAVDAAVLGGRVDGVVMVVRAHHSDVPTLTDALGRLQRGGAQMVGAVFNDMRPTGRAPVALAP